MDDVFVRYYDMPTTIRSYAVANQDGSYTVIINSRLSTVMQSEAYLHEVAHIKNGDFAKRCSVGMIEIIAHAE